MGITGSGYTGSDKNGTGAQWGLSRQYTGGNNSGKGEGIDDRLFTYSPPPPLNPDNAFEIYYAFEKVSTCCVAKDRPHRDL